MKSYKSTRNILQTGEHVKLQSADKEIHKMIYKTFSLCRSDDIRTAIFVYCSKCLSKINTKINSLKSLCWQSDPPFITIIFFESSLIDNSINIIIEYSDWSRTIAYWICRWFRGKFYCYGILTEKYLDMKVVASRLTLANVRGNFSPIGAVHRHLSVGSKILK